VAIILTKNSSIAKTLYRGHGSVVVPPGKTLRIETSPEGVEILAVDVPADEEWVVNLNINVTAREPS